MNFDLDHLGFPTLEQVYELGITPSQFMDVMRWMHRGINAAWYVGWFKRPRMITGWEICDFIREQKRP